MYHSDLASCVDEFNGLSTELKSLEDLHKKYLQRLKDLNDLQSQCLKSIGHQKYRMKVVQQSMRRQKKSSSISEEDFQKINKIEEKIMKQQHRINDMEEYLPRKNGLYLHIILGTVNVSLMDKNQRYKYKDEYEKFKLVVTSIALIMSFLNYALFSYRFMDLAFLFLLVWYYCTLTIRESILRVNGSRIKGWWRTHHFLSTAAAGLLLIWPDGRSYHEFRSQFMVFNMYIGLVQLLQFKYQQGCLYRLKSLGERHNMDITIEGFHSWMWRGLSFLLPFLFVGYFFQLYNAYVLFVISQQETCTEWQVIVLSAMFLVLFLGNMITTLFVIPQKLREKISLKYRFQSLIGKRPKANNDASELENSKLVNEKRE